MATTLKSLSLYDPASVPSGKGKSVGIVVSEWNHDITGALLKGALKTLVQHGVKKKDIIVEYVPGSFELVYGAKILILEADVDSVIVIGCVIQGETPHFTYVCNGVTQGITSLNVEYHTPTIFGVLTTDTLEQAKERAGGIHGNKGDEAAITALKMMAFADKYDELDLFSDDDDDYFPFDDQQLDALKFLESRFNSFDNK